MIFKRIGAKKHKYHLELTLSTIKYCPWDSPYIVIVLIRGRVYGMQEISMSKAPNTTSTRVVATSITTS